MAEIKISRDFPGGLNVLIAERSGIATFCRENDCFILDEEGIVFKKDSDERLFRPLIKTLIPGGQMDLGEKAIEKEELSRILKINSQINKDLKIPLEGFIISEKQLTALTQEGWEVYFNLQGDVEWQLMKLKALLEEKIPPEKRSSLEYIELRFGNLANPKYRE